MIWLHTLDLIIAKLHAYSFNMPLPKLMNSYLTNTHQKLAKWLSVRSWTKWLWVRVQLQSLKNKYSDSQRLIFGPVSFNIFIGNLLFITDNVDVASYADGNTPYTYRKLPNKVLEKLECVSKNIFEWFFNNAEGKSRKISFSLKSWYEHKISVSSLDIKNMWVQK